MRDLHVQLVNSELKEMVKPPVESKDVPDIELVFARSKQVLSKLKIGLAGLIALRSWEEDLGTFDQTCGHGEDAHQESPILSRANQAPLRDRDEFLD